MEEPEGKGKVGLNSKWADQSWYFNDLWAKTKAEEKDLVLKRGKKKAGDVQAEEMKAKKEGVKELLSENTAILEQLDSETANEADLRIVIKNMFEITDISENGTLFKLPSPDLYPRQKVKFAGVSLSRIYGFHKWITGQTEKFLPSRDEGIIDKLKKAGITKLTVELKESKEDEILRKMGY